MPPQHPHTPQPSNERGQTLAEYAILISGIAIVVAVAVPLVGTALSGLFTAVANAFPG
jgi:Flp pilus assembly pilin Flp